ncbi:MAG: hypothetical protein KKG59_06020 [Nanoarchaeota archaeon]|nr:hypothetical protein [Nanoarchaeota archaeon]
MNNNSYIWCDFQAKACQEAGKHPCHRHGTDPRTKRYVALGQTIVWNILRYSAVWPGKQKYDYNHPKLYKPNTRAHKK